MTKPAPVRIRVTGLPQFRQLISFAPALPGALASSSGDLPEAARLAADQVKRDMAALQAPLPGPAPADAMEDQGPGLRDRPEGARYAAPLRNIPGTPRNQARGGRP